MAANVGEKNARWRGDRRVDAKGYVRVRAPHHPYANSNGYVFEHRLAVEEH
jgi:hypothetical protein